MAEDWMTQRIDQHSLELANQKARLGVLKQRVDAHDGQYAHLHSCLHEFRGETRKAFKEIHDAVHALEGRLKDQLHETDNKWNDRLIKVETKPPKKDESLVTLRDVGWVVVVMAAAAVAYFLK